MRDPKPPCAYTYDELPPAADLQPPYWAWAWEKWWWGRAAGDGRLIAPVLERVRMEVCRDLIGLLGLAALGSFDEDTRERIEASLRRLSAVPAITAEELRPWELANALGDIQAIMGGEHLREKRALETERVAAGYRIAPPTPKTPPSPPTPWEVPF